MKYNKGFGVITVILIIVGVLVVGGGVYLLGKNKGGEKKGIENPIVNNQTTGNFISYVDPTYGFSLSYDKSKPFTEEKPFSIDASMVKSVYLCIKDGKNYLGDPVQLKGMGFSNISGCEYKQYGFNNQIPTVDMVANEAINHKLRPFGENPIIQDITLSGQPAKIVLSDSKNIEDPEAASIFVKLPNPIVRDKSYSSYILIIYTTKPFVQDIVSSFKFLDREELLDVKTMTEDQALKEVQSWKNSIPIFVGDFLNYKEGMKAFPIPNGWVADSVVVNGTKINITYPAPKQTITPNDYIAIHFPASLVKNLKTTGCIGDSEVSSCVIGSDPTVKWYFDVMWYFQ